MLAFNRYFRIVAVVTVATASIVLGESAQAATCVSLKAELVELGGSSSEARRYRDSIARQRVQIAQVRKLQRARSCASRRSKTCSVLDSSLGSMKRNLRSLVHRVGVIERTGKSKRRRLRNRIAIKCDKRSAARSARLRRIRANEEAKRARPDETTRSATELRARLGTFSTMCVRMCDGFAFPVSFATVPRQFGTDARACEALCPGAGTRLYAAPAGKNSIAEARDVETGEPYADLSTAFRHREVFDRSCACRATRSTRLDFGTPIALPRRRKDAVPLKPAPEVRIVGPDYFAAR